MLYHVAVRFAFMYQKNFGGGSSVQPVGRARISARDRLLAGPSLGRRPSVCSAPCLRADLHACRGGKATGGVTRFIYRRATHHGSNIIFFFFLFFFRRRHTGISRTGRGPGHGDRALKPTVTYGLLPLRGRGYRLGPSRSTLRTRKNP